MTIELAYYIAQIVAAIAILGTLYYGIRQIRMNNELTRVQHINTSMTGYMDMNLKLGETPQMARVWTLGLKDDPSLSEDERRQFNLILFAAFYGYEGQFEMSQSPMSGDLYLRVHIAPHSIFRLNGSDLELDAPVAPWEAALGARIEVPIVGGKASVKLQPGIQSGRRLRLKGKGFPNREGGHGDLYVRVLIQVPENLTAQEKKLFEELSRISRFHPRRW